MKKTIPAIILLTGLITAYALSLLPWSENLNHYAYDLLMSRTKITSSDNNNIIIGIDDESLERFDDPLVLWHKYLAKIIDGVAESGARSIALDIIPSISLDKLAPELDRQLIQSMKKSRDNGTPVYLGFMASKNGPSPHLKFIFASSKMGFLNLYPDSDRRIRKQFLTISSGSGRKASAISVLSAQSGSEAFPADLPEIIYIDYRLTMSPTISFLEVYDWVRNSNRDMLESTFKDKRVLIGVTSASLPDMFNVPIISSLNSSSRLPGVVIQSMSTSTLLSEDLLRDVPGEITLGISLLLGIVSGVLFLILSPRKAAVFIVILFILAAAGTIKAFQAFWVIPIALPVFALLVPGLITGTYRYVVEYRQFRRLQRYFKSYVNEEVMQNIIDNPKLVSLEGQHVVASVMFTDIRNFTTISEKLHPSDVVTGLNRYFAEMTKPVIECGGYLNEYMGDGILAIFGVPQTMSDDGAWAAVQCGINMLKNVEALNKSGIFPGISDKLKIGIGIHTGEAIVGNIGCYEKMKYSIIGDTVNLASRIESATKEYSAALLVSEETYERVKERVEAKFVTATRVKGRAQEVKLYEILSLKEV
jgi:adenylate cyclase